CGRHGELRSGNAETSPRLPKGIGQLETGKRRRGADGRFLADTQANPERVRVDYEDRVLPVADVAIKHRISASTLHRMAVRYGWTPREPHRIDPNDLLMRMFSALDAQ